MAWKSVESKRRLAVAGAGGGVGRRRWASAEVIEVIEAIKVREVIKGIGRSIATSTE
jgi:hypothetical protein